jgi:hypothetical protein
MNTWELAILRTIAEAGGELDLQGIYRGVGGFIRLSGEHLQLTAWSGRPAYHHQVRSHISNLCQVTQLRSVARARYVITSAGRSRISHTS